MERLNREEEYDAMMAYEDYTGTEAAEVLYCDDFDAQKSTFQVVDVRGHGDGSGVWTPVSEC
jgi:hypothetical protein